MRGMARLWAAAWTPSALFGVQRQQLSAVRPVAAIAPAAFAHGSNFAVAGLSASRRFISTYFRGEVYYSGSHYEKEHMVGAKNPELPADKLLAEAAVKVFGTAATSNPHQRSVRKLLLKPLKGQAIVDYYPKYLKHNQHGYQDPHRLRQEEKLIRLKRHGKGPPKKGEGKRAKKAGGKK